MQAAVGRVAGELGGAGPGTIASKASARSIAADIDVTLTSLDMILFEIFSEAWNLEYRGSADIPLLDTAASQVAGRLVEDDRSRVNLVEDLLQSLRKGRDAESIFKAMISTKSTFQVACVVYGASELRRIRALLPGARSIRLQGPEPGGWGASTEPLREFFRKQHINRKACLVLVPVEASDKGGSAVRGRRAVEELLDHYVSASRSLDLHMGDVTLVGSVDRFDTAEFSIRGRSVASAYPLSVDWSEEFREAMRMAHLARSVEAPLAKGALSWVALESCGIKQSKNRDLARALSLQSFRQYVVRSYDEFRDCFGAEHDFRSRSVSAKMALLTKLRRTLENLPRESRDTRAIVEERLNVGEADLQAAEGTLVDFDASIGALFGRVESFVGGRTADGRYLSDLDPWLTLLNLPAPDEGQTAATARAALKELIQRFSHPAVLNVDTWMHRFSQPQSCTHWIEDAADRIQSMLDTLYAVRNLTFHTGVFAHHGDSSLGRSGVVLIDLTLEFLGNWRRAEGRLMPPGLRQKDSLSIIEELASRQQFVVSQLNNSSHTRGLNVAHLTGPGISGWDRL
jgi:hypothetical protein